MHKKCRIKQIDESKYKNPDRYLLENVPVYSVESLIAELTASAESLREAWKQSVEINESMGVKLAAADKKRLENAAKSLFNTINRINKEN